MSKMEFVHIGFGSNVSVRAMAKMTSAKNQSLIKIEKKKKRNWFLFLWAHILAKEQDMNIQCRLCVPYKKVHRDLNEEN